MTGGAAILERMVREGLDKETFWNHLYIDSI